MRGLPSDAAGERLVTTPFLVAVLSTFGGMLSLGVLLPVLPRFADGPLEAGGVGIGLSVGASSITAVVAQPLIGRLGDTRGRRALLIGGPLVLALVGLAYVPADSLAAVIGLRLVAGVGEGMVLVAGVSVVTDLAPPNGGGRRSATSRSRRTGGWRSDRSWERPCSRVTATTASGSSRPRSPSAR